MDLEGRIEKRIGRLWLAGSVVAVAIALSGCIGIGDSHVHNSPLRLAGKIVDRANHPLVHARLKVAVSLSVYADEIPKTVMNGRDPLDDSKTLETDEEGAFSQAFPEREYRRSFVLIWPFVPRSHCPDDVRFYLALGEEPNTVLRFTVRDEKVKREVLTGSKKALKLGAAKVTRSKEQDTVHITLIQDKR